MHFFNTHAFFNTQYLAEYLDPHKGLLSAEWWAKQLQFLPCNSLANKTKSSSSEDFVYFMVPILSMVPISQTLDREND